MLELRADHVMFSTNWPFENVDHVADRFDSALISDQDPAARAVGTRR